MLDALVRADAVEAALIGGLGADAVELAFGAAVEQQDRLVRAEVHEEVVRRERDVRALAAAAEASDPASVVAAAHMISDLFALAPGVGSVPSTVSTMNIWKSRNLSRQLPREVCDRRTRKSRARRCARRQATT